MRKGLVSAGFQLKGDTLLRLHSGAHRFVLGIISEHHFSERNACDWFELKAPTSRRKPGGASPKEPSALRSKPKRMHERFILPHVLSEKCNKLAA
jgi:hypothetical protein